MNTKLNKSSEIYVNNSSNRANKLISNIARRVSTLKSEIDELEKSLSFSKRDLESNSHVNEDGDIEPIKERSEIEAYIDILKSEIENKNKKLKLLEKRNYNILLKKENMHLGIFDYCVSIYKKIIDIKKQNPNQTWADVYNMFFESLQKKKKMDTKTVNSVIRFFKDNFQDIKKKALENSDGTQKNNSRTVAVDLKKASGGDL